MAAGMYWNQQKSQLPKNGEPESHRLAREITQTVLKKAGYTVFNDFPLDVHWKFGTPELRDGQVIKIERLLNKMNERTRYYHEYDVIGVKVFDSGLSEILVIEIDGRDTPHDEEFNDSKATRKQINNDRTAYQWARFLLPDMIFVRLPKEIIIKYQDERDKIWSEILAGKKINYSNSDKKIELKWDNGTVIKQEEVNYYSDKGASRVKVIKSDNSNPGFPE